MAFSKSPVYNLKAVLRETGIKPDVLRAWERRYGLPLPQRTAGGHRLYSEYDVQTIKWLISRQNNGLSISRAVDMWKELVSQGRDPFVDSSSAARSQVINLQPLQQAIYLPPETNIDSLRAHWLAACLNFNETAAEQTLNQAFGMYPVETVCIDVLQRGMAEIGTLWYENRASVQQEHFASGLAMRRLDSLLSSAPPPTRSQSILVGCPSEEWHTFTPLLISLFLRRRGLGVIYLGANVPANRFEETISAVQPSLVILASQQLSTASTLQQTALMLSARGSMVAFGGRIFSMQPEIVRTIPGHFLGDRFETAVERIESLLSVHPDAPQIVAASAEYNETLKVFITKRPLIEAAINDTLRQSAGDMDYFQIANQFMGNNIIAALHLGNMNYLNSEIDWLNMMLKSQNLPLKIVSDYLSSYVRAVRAHLKDQGQPIAQWLDYQLNTYQKQ